MKEKSYSAISGTSLRDRIIQPEAERKALIEGFLYEHSALMIASDPGLGKSVVLTCAFAQMSAGLPVFNSLMVPRPLKCYLIPFERGISEIAERLRHMQEVIPINYENLFINENFIGMDTTNPKHADFIIDQIKKDCPKPDAIGLDPIYAAVAGGLSTDEKASLFCRFSARLQHEFGCSVWLNHHTVKTQMFKGEEHQRSDPFYGSQWLKAHVTASYHLRESKDGVLLEKKKDSHGNLITQLNLGYNPDNYTCYGVGIDQATTKKEKGVIFFRTCFQAKKQFFYSEFFDALGGIRSGVSDSYTRELLRTPPFEGSYLKHKSTGGKTLYEITKLI